MDKKFEYGVIGFTYIIPLANTPIGNGSFASIEQIEKIEKTEERDKTEKIEKIETQRK